MSEKMINPIFKNIECIFIEGDRPVPPGTKFSFFEYHQNNTGGFFVDDENISKNVIIAAESAAAADRRAESIGIYFNGIDADKDCYCCGDRWYRAIQGSDTPSLYGETVEQHLSNSRGLFNDGCIVYYPDMSRMIYRRKKRKDTKRKNSY